VTDQETTPGSGWVPRPSTSHPERIGPYRIIRVLGQGGMGLVYEAEQLEPLRRMVALKVIRRGMDTEEVLARFEGERQALAVMDHPNIARAFDAGTTEDGLPYFVMELVAGVPINEYCDTHKLDIRHRLELFVAVCKGVQHAHQKGVIHRDLKPSNILVRVTDGKPVPTIIDFGIAKAVDTRLSEKGFVTALGEMVGTPVYMSPEQAEASGLDIDTRADIYSLGMVLYELVTGMLPFDSAGLMPFYYIMKYVLSDADVPTPSRRLSTLAGNSGSQIALQRHTTPQGLRRELKGDLDWIVLKAIQRDRALRYETASALGLDIERFLQHKTVGARPPTLSYTASRFIRRHRLAVSIGVTAAIALVVLVTSIARERNRAELEGAKAQAISTFLQEMLQSADPWRGAGDRQTTVVEALQAGVARLNSAGVADPAVASLIRHTIGNVYLSLGRVGEADTLLRAALAERRARTGSSSEETAESLNDLGWLYYEQGKFDSAEVFYRSSLDLRQRIHGPNDTLVALTIINLSSVANVKGEHELADSLGHRGLDILRSVYGDRHMNLVPAMARLTSSLLSSGQLAQAESLAQTAIGILRENRLDRTAQVSGIMNDLALSLAFQGRTAEALALMHQLVPLDSALFGHSHPDLAAHLENMGLVYSYAGFQDSNALMLHQALAMRRAVLADDNPAIGRSLFNLAQVEYVAGDYAAAEPLYKEALERMRAAYGAEHTDVVWATGTLGRTQYLRGGRAAEAERNLRWALEVDDPDGRLQPADYPKIAHWMVALLMDQHRWAEAEPIALRILALRDSMSDTLAVQSAAQLADLYEGWGKPAKAAEFRGRIGVRP
jgi:eukaryotic-like serine/threonine-protein kinase